MIKKRENEKDFKQVVDLFLNEKKSNGLSEASIYNYTLSLKYFQQDTGINMIDELTKNTIMNWVNNCTKGTTTINHYLRDVRCFAYWCMENDYILPFKIKLVKGQQPKIKYYTDDEIQMLLKKPKNDASFSEWRTYYMIIFCLSTGARAGTVVNVQLEDIDFKANLITYTRQKNKTTNTIPMPETLKYELKNYLKMYSRDNDGYLFCDLYEHKLTVNGFQIAMQRYCKKRGLEKHSIHALRHTYARTFLLNGGGIYQLSKILQHSDITTTQGYVHLLGEELRDDVNKFNPFDTLKPKKITKINKFWKKLKNCTFFSAILIEGYLL